MAKYGSNALTIEFDNTTPALIDISNFITEMSGITLMDPTEESHAFGDSWVEHLYTGVVNGEDVSFSGFYDNTLPDGPNDIFNDIGNSVTRTLRITWGGTKTTDVETVIKSYNKSATRGELTKFEVVLAQTGAATEA